MLRLIFIKQFAKGIFKMDNNTVKNMVNFAKQGLQERTVDEVQNMLNNDDVCIIDIRDSSECIENGIIPGSFHVSRGVLEFNADPECEYYKDFFDKNVEILLYCHTGSRSALASLTLRQMGYEKISHMKGGFKEWMRKIGNIDDYKAL